jgi:Ger(x)C family germination protein
MVNVIQIIKLPGGFIQRQDAIILGIWMLSIFSILSAFFYYISFIGKFIFHISSQNYLLVPFILLLFGASVIPLETEQFFYYFENYMKFIGMPQSILLPAIIVFIGKVRKIKTIKPVKPVLKTILMITALTSVISLTGCSDMTEIEDRNFVQTVGIDYRNNELTVFYVLPDLKALTEQGSQNPEKLVIELKGFDFYEIEELYGLQYNKRLDFSHLKAIILGKDLAADRTQMAQFLTYAENKYELGRNTLIFASDTSASDVISLNKDIEGGIGDYLDRLYRINLKNSGKKVVTVGDLVFAMNEENPVISVPLLKPNKKTLKTIGFGMFYHNILVYEVNKDEANYTDISNGYGKNILIFLTENQEEDLKEEKSEALTEYVVKINNITRTLKFSRVNNKPEVVIRLEGIGIIEKGFKDKGQTSNAANAAVIEEIERRCNQVIKTRVTANLDKITKEAGIDFMNLYRMTSYKNRKLWLEYANNEKQFLKDLSYTVNVDLKIQ